MTANLTEQWYIAVLVYESRIVENATDDDDGRVDVQYRLVRAVDAESAYERALALGKRGQLSYANTNGDTCEWTFSGLSDLRAVDDQDLRHGSELYGFIEKGRASGWVVPKDELTEFRAGRSAD